MVCSIAKPKLLNTNLVDSIEKQLHSLRYDGYRNTPLLWNGELEGLDMLVTEEQHSEKHPTYDANGSHIRLGKLIEQFVLFDLDQIEALQVLQSNIQIFKDKITLGELDAIIQHLEKVVHLEIVYKFYLYDPKLPHELNRWIGPNRNDSLVQKLQKLKDKQLPLLHRPETFEAITKLNINPLEIEQKVLFKAQLYVPYKSSIKKFSYLNNACISGYYIRLEDLNDFQKHTFHVPDKLDWLIIPHLDVEWLALCTFVETISNQLALKKSPICWIKSENGELQKFFLVWWV
jgi:hypothetical protein